MKLGDFVKDHLPAYLIYGFGWVLVLIFLTAFGVNLQAIVAVSVIFWLAILSAQLWNFLRKRHFYNKLNHCLAELDKKYLICEMLDTPDFYEGEILCETLRESNKSMCENIAVYRHESEQFREYIELWVHEIKLPLATLQLMCHNDCNQKYLAQIKKIDDYVENVLFYARSDNAEKDYLIKDVMLKSVFTDVAIKNREELQCANAMLKTENLNVKVTTDGKWLEYIFGQLMGNSMKYFSPDRDPEITVSAQGFPDKTVLRFRDNGIGIPESDLPYVFEKSFTGENGRTHARSTGMGLYIVKNLCEKLGHSVSVCSVQGEYTEVSITFGRNDFNKIQ